MLLKEALGPYSSGGYNSLGGGNGAGGTWSSWHPYHYTPSDGTTSAYDPECILDPDIERQLIDYAIDLLYSRYPELVDNKTIKRHVLQMVIGKITSGEPSDQITMKNFIKQIKKKKGVKVV
jgi:hypothetical protein